MKKSTILIFTLYLLISLHFACKKNSMPDLTDNESIANDSLRILDSINMVIMEKLTPHLGNYNVTCRLRTTDIIGDSSLVEGYKEVEIDSLFLDTVVLNIYENTSQDINIVRYINEKKILVSTKFLRHNYNDIFLVTNGADMLKFSSILDGYSCKCNVRMRLKSDSIFYSSYQMSSFDINIECM